jgi:uncharacterized RDD family membrane protein YckC
MCYDAAIAMAGACPKCGWRPVDGSTCPRCGVDVAGYLAGLAARAPVAAPAALEQPAAISPASLARPDLRPAGFWIRVVAVVIDTAVILVAQAVLYAVASMVFGGRSSIAIRGATQVFGAMLISVYPMLFHWRWGQTLGKMAVDIRVVTCRPTPTSPGWLTDSGPLTLGCAALRQLASVLSSVILGVGYLMAGLRRDKRALHDLIAGTRVERLP